MQKHEREAFRTIRAIASRYGVAAELFNRGKHSEKVRLTSPGGAVATIGLPSSPGDTAWAVVVARKQAQKHCLALLEKDASGEKAVSRSAEN